MHTSSSQHDTVHVHTPIEPTLDSALSSSESIPSPSLSTPVSSFDPHNTNWADVSISRFIVWMSVISTVENSIFYPFYVLKTRQQSFTAQHSVFSLSNSTLHHLQQIRKEHGIRRGLYRGFLASNFVTLPAYGVYMGVYTWCKDQLGYNKTNTEWSSLYAPFIAGVVADAASVALYVPGDVILQRLQLRNSPYKSFNHAVTVIWRTEGYKGFFRGLGATFLTSALASAIWWSSYENIKSRLYEFEEKQQNITSSNSSTSSTSTAPSTISPLTDLYSALFSVNRRPQLIAGFLAGSFTSTILNPLDVVKTRLQIQSNSEAQISNTSRYKNVFHGLYRLCKEEGLQGCFRGVIPKLISRGPLSAASSILYELVLYLSRNDSRSQSSQQQHKTYR